MERGRKPPAGQDDAQKPFTPWGETTRVGLGLEGTEAGGRREMKAVRAAHSLDLPTLGALHSLRPPGLLSLPLSTVARGSRKVSGFWARVLPGELMGSQETPHRKQASLPDGILALFPLGQPPRRGRFLLVTQRSWDQRGGKCPSSLPSGNAALGLSSWAAEGSQDSWTQAARCSGSDPRFPIGL